MRTGAAMLAITGTCVPAAGLVKRFRPALAAVELALGTSNLWPL